MAPSGYDFQTVEPIKVEYSCPKCKALLKEAVRTPCGHVMCNCCLRKSKDVIIYYGDDGEISCPCCHQTFDKTKIQSCPSVDQHIAKSIQIYCKCKTNGCDWTGQIEQYSDHEIECSYKKIACPNDGCYVFLMRKALIQHDKVCDQRRVKCKLCKHEILYVDYNEHSKKCINLPIKCTNASCIEEFPKSQLQEHLTTECLHQMVECPFTELGCSTSKVRRKSLKNYLSDSTHRHMMLMVQQINQNKVEMSLLKQELDVKTKELQLASLKISSLENQTK